MVATAETKVRLMTLEWQSVSVDAACANRLRKVPGNDNTFTIQASPNQAELVELMPVLDRAQVDSYTRQAAVWIVTDNADFNAFDVLKVTYDLGPGSYPVTFPAIGAGEAARAMRILDEAGIDLRRKAIWKDRAKITSSLKAGDLKTWLEQKK
jgi:hypothetical protein